MLTYELVSKMPRFLNHISARVYLKEIYGELIVMRSVDNNENDKYYKYHFVLNKQDYIENFTLEQKGLFYDETVYERSYQEFFITCKGGILLECPIKQKISQ